MFNLLKSKSNNKLKFPNNIMGLSILSYNLNNLPDNLDSKGTSAPNNINNTNNFNTNNIDNFNIIDNTNNTNNIDNTNNKIKYKYKPRPKPRTKSTSINCAARNTISDLVSGLEKEYTIHKLTFWTHTIPPKIWNRLKKRFNEYISRLFLYLKRFCASRGVQFHYIRVVEIHEDGRPHIHAVFHARKNNTWLITPQDIDNIVLKVIRSFKINVTLNDLKASNQLKRIRKSAVRYLSKLTSKQATSDWVPTSWYSADRGTYRIKEKYEHSFLIEYDNIYTLKSFLVSLGIYVRLIHKEINGVSRVVGGWGIIPKRRREEILSVLSSVSIFVDSKHSCPLPQKSD